MDLSNFVNQALGLLITGFIPLTIYLLRNQAKAQRIINDEFPKIRAELDSERKARAENEKEAAKREGTLNERVRNAEAQLLQAQRNDRQNIQSITTLKTTVAILRRQHQEQTELLTKVLRERDDASKVLTQKEAEAAQKDATILELRGIIEVTTGQLTKALADREDLQRQIDELREYIGIRNAKAAQIETVLGEEENEPISDLQIKLPGFNNPVSPDADDPGADKPGEGSGSNTGTNPS